MAQCIVTFSNGETLRVQSTADDFVREIELGVGVGTFKRRTSSDGGTRFINPSQIAMVTDVVEIDYGRASFS
jgi:hypothetical protein